MELTTGQQTAKKTHDALSIHERENLVKLVNKMTIHEILELPKFGMTVSSGLLGLQVHYRYNTDNLTFIRGVDLAFARNEVRTSLTIEEGTVYVNPPSSCLGLRPNSYQISFRKNLPRPIYCVLSPSRLSTLINNFDLERGVDIKNSLEDLREASGTIGHYLATSDNPVVLDYIKGISKMITGKVDV